MMHAVSFRGMLANRDFMSEEDTNKLESYSTTFLRWLSKGAIFLKLLLYTKILKVLKWKKRDEGHADTSLVEWEKFLNSLKRGSMPEYTYCLYFLPLLSEGEDYTKVLKLEFERGVKLYKLI